MNYQLTRFLVGITFIASLLLIKVPYISSVGPILISLEIAFLIFNRLLPWTFIFTIPFLLLVTIDLIPSILITLWGLCIYLGNKLSYEPFSPLVPDTNKNSFAGFLLLFLLSFWTVINLMQFNIMQLDLSTAFAQLLHSPDFITNSLVAFLLAYGFYIQPNIAIFTGLIAALLISHLLPILALFMSFSLFMYSEMIITQIKMHYGIVRKTIFIDAFSPIIVILWLSGLFTLILKPISPQAISLIKSIFQG